MRFAILPLERRDWPAVRALMAATPMSAALPLVLTRAEDPAKSYPSLDAEEHGFVALEDGELRGFIHGRMQRLLVPSANGLSPMPMAYIGDLRIARASQGKGLTQALLSRIVEEGRARSVRLGYGLVNEGNDRMLRALGRVGGLSFDVVESFVTAARLIVRTPRRTDAYEPFVPDEAELRALHATFAGRPFAPVLEPDQFVRSVRGVGGLRWFRRRANARGIAFALWDPSVARTLSLARSPMHLRALRLAWNGLRPVLGAHEFPRDGVPWVAREVAFVAPDEDLEQIAAAAAWETHREGGHLTTFIERPGVRTSGPLFRLRTNIVSMSLDGEVPRPVRGAAPFIELPFI